MGMNIILLQQYHLCLLLLIYVRARLFLLFPFPLMSDILRFLSLCGRNTLVMSHPSSWYQVSD